MKIETTQFAVDMFGLACCAMGFGLGWVLCWRKQVERVRESEYRRQEAYRRYWNGYPYDDKEPF